MFSECVRLFAWLRDWGTSLRNKTKSKYKCVVILVEIGVAIGVSRRFNNEAKAHKKEKLLESF